MELDVAFLIKISKYYRLISQTDDFTIKPSQAERPHQVLTNGPPARVRASMLVLIGGYTSVLCPLQLVKLCSGMIEAGKAYVSANKLFVSGVRDLSQQCKKDEMISVSPSRRAGGLFAALCALALSPVAVLFPGTFHSGASQPDY